MRFTSAVIQSLQLKHMFGRLSNQRSWAHRLGLWLGFWLWLGFGLCWLWFGFGWSWLGFWKLFYDGFFDDFLPSWGFIFRTGWSTTLVLGRVFDGGLRQLSIYCSFFNNRLNNRLSILNNVKNWLVHF